MTYWLTDMFFWIILVDAKLTQCKWQFCLVSKGDSPIGLWAMDPNREGEKLFSRTDFLVCRREMIHFIPEVSYGMAVSIIV